MPSRLLIAVVVFVAACAGESASTFFKSTPTYKPTAQENYEAGVRELKKGNWLNAEAFFKHVRSTFGFSKWATLSELGIADAQFGRDKMTEAIDGYKAFIKTHPGNERVQDGYAAFRIGFGYYKQIPSDFFIMPPAYEKDQGPVLDALRELTAFTDQYGDSPYASEARRLLGECVKRLTDHELYVAGFYLKGNHPYAAIGRLEGIIKEFPASQREPEIMLLLGKTYLKMEKPVEARATFAKLAQQHPEDFRAQKARLYIQFIDKKYAGRI